jgi:hypothetical protein
VLECDELKSTDGPAQELLEQLSLDSPDWDPPKEYPMSVAKASSATDLDSSALRYDK